MLTKKFFCPVNGWDCPYWKEDGSCSMVDDGDNPVMECDDAGYFFGDDEKSPFVWEDEDGNRYDEDELLEQGYHIVIVGKPVSHEEFLQKVEEYKRELEHAPRWVNTSGVGPTCPPRWPGRKLKK